MSSATPPTRSGRLRRRRRSTGDEAAHPHLRWRGDIEGLRAVAVLLVLFDHFGLLGFRGGFIGVDVFFVISGFLITGLMRKEYRESGARAYSRQGKLDFRGFYQRRARRILPAALTVIAFTLVAAKLLFNELRFQQVQADALWATFFGANLQLMKNATDYFASNAVLSPLQNYWSLAVEEQFYIVWPALFAVAAMFQTWSGKRVNWRGGVRLMSLLIFVFSLGWSIYATAKNPGSAYFSPLTRAFELAFGASLAMRTRNLARIPREAAKWVAAGGVGLLALALLVVSPGTPYPGWRGLLPVLGAGLIIAAGVGEGNRTAVSTALSHKAPRFIGRISYSLYLWHWPLLVFAWAELPSASRTVPFRVGLFAAAIGIAYLSWRFIEEPFRRMKAPTEPLARSEWMRTNNGKVTAMAVAGVVVVGVIALWARPIPAVQTASQVEAAARADHAVSKWSKWDGSSGVDGGGDGATAGAPTPAPTVAEWNAALREAVDQTKLTASEKTLAMQSASLGPDTSCYSITDASAVTRCAIPDTSGDGRLAWKGGSGQRVAMIGNSIAAQWRSALSAALPNHTSYTQITLEGCEADAKPGSSDVNEKGVSCGDHWNFVKQELSKAKFDLVVVSNGLASTPQGMGDLVAMAAGTGAKVLWISPPPTAKRFEECLSGSDVTPCNGPTRRSDQKVAEYAAQARASKVNFWNLSGTLCLRGVCPAFIGGYPVRLDGGHLTARMMDNARSMLEQALLAVPGLKKA